MADSARRLRGPSRAFWAIAGVVLLVGVVTALLVLFDDRNASLTSANPAADATAGRGNPSAAPAPSQPPANRVEPNQPAPRPAPARLAPTQPGPGGAAPARDGATTPAASSPANHRVPTAIEPHSPANHRAPTAIEPHSPVGHPVSSRAGGESGGRDDASEGDGDHRRRHVSVDDWSLEDRTDGSLLGRLTNPLDLLGDLAHAW
jgi:hypothetical protein